jgi:hypothetical protein
MTNEEAIENLKGCVCGYEVGDDGKPNGNVTADLTQEIIDMAIKALEQEPCEDCISREEVSKLLNDGWRKGIYPRDAIMALPSVTPKFTDAEIQKMQELEQAQLDKAYELGKAEMQPCEDCISRTALLARIDEERKHLLAIKMDGAEHILVHHARRIIEDMPSVTPKASED